MDKGPSPQPTKPLSAIPFSANSLGRCPYPEASLWLIIPWPWERPCQGGWTPDVLGPCLVSNYSRLKVRICGLEEGKKEFLVRQICYIFKAGRSFHIVCKSELCLGLCAEWPKHKAKELLGILPLRQD